MRLTPAQQPATEGVLPKESDPKTLGWVSLCFQRSLLGFNGKSWGKVLLKRYKEPGARDSWHVGFPDVRMSRFAAEVERLPRQLAKDCGCTQPRPRNKSADSRRGGRPGINIASGSIKVQGTLQNQHPSWVALLSGGYPWGFPRAGSL